MSDFQHYICWLETDTPRYMLPTSVQYWHHFSDGRVRGFYTPAYMLTHLTLEDIEDEEASWREYVDGPEGSDSEDSEFED